MKKLLILTVTFCSIAHAQANVETVSLHVGAITGTIAGLFATSKTAKRLEHHQLRAILTYAITGEESARRFIQKTKRIPYIVGTVAALAGATASYFTIKLGAQLASKKQTETN